MASSLILMMMELRKSYPGLRQSLTMLGSFLTVTVTARSIVVASCLGTLRHNPTPPEGESRNGFRALAEYDKPDKGGNGDGLIDQNDTVFVSLHLWQDSNHNGISEFWELHTLMQLNVESISLDFRESRRTDQYGNQFRYRVKVTDSKGAQLGRWAWDVFLLRQ